MICFLADHFLSGASPALLDAGSWVQEMSLSATKPETATGFIEVQRPMAFANPLIHVPADGRAITPTPFFGRQQKVKKIGGFDETVIVVTTSTALSIASTISTSTVAATTVSASAVSTVFPKILSEGEEGHEIYDEVIEMAPVPEFIMPVVPSNYSFTHEGRTPTPKISETAGKSGWRRHHSEPSFFVGNAGKLSQPSGDTRNDGRSVNGLSKLLKAIPDEIRRSPLKGSLAAARTVNEVSFIAAFVFFT